VPQSDVIETAASEEGGLVDTPEAKPAPKPRKPRQRRPRKEVGENAPAPTQAAPDTPKAAE
jgi:hypothetical protein